MKHLMMIAGLVVVGSCTIPQLVSPNVNQTLQKCLAQDRDSPFVVEWSPQKLGSMDVIAEQSVVIVSYDGCNSLKVLNDCRVSAGYDMKRIPVRSKTITISNESQLYSKLPLGAVGLKAELSNDKSIELNYVITGMKKASSTPKLGTLVGQCSGATHFVSIMYVGAFEVRSGTAKALTAGASIAGVGAGAAGSHAVKQVSQNGDVNRCKASGLSNDCQYTFQLHLKKLASHSPNPRTKSISTVTGALRAKRHPMATPGIRMTKSVSATTRILPRVQSALHQPATKPPRKPQPVVTTQTQTPPTVKPSHSNYTCPEDYLKSRGSRCPQQYSNVTDLLEKMCDGSFSESDMALLQARRKANQIGDSELLMMFNIVGCFYGYSYRKLTWLNTLCRDPQRQRWLPPSCISKIDHYSSRADTPRPYRQWQSRIKKYRTLTKNKQ